MTTRLRLWRRNLPAAAALAIATAAAHAASFEVAVSPSRFEIAAKPATRAGQSLSVFNVGAEPANVAIRTLDWRYSDKGDVTYHEDLLPGSCRPWVTLERRTLRVPPRGRTSFRFQVDVPADAPRGECRFMLAIEGAEPAYQVRMDGNPGSQLSLPVSGRIAIAVYVAIDGAVPKLEVRELAVQDNAGKRTPVITVSNTGNAHGRLEGSLEAVTAKGEKLELVPESTPILPGQTRVLPLSPKPDPARRTQVELAWPLKASGELEWSQGTFKINAELR